MDLYAWAYTVVGLKEPIVFRSKHLDKLTPARQEITHLTGFLIRQQSYLGLYLQAEKSEYPGINSVGLGQDTGSTSEITYLAGIDDDYR